ncbi:MAG: dockerin type I domain-containing protein [Pirellulales bacterium]
MKHVVRTIGIVTTLSLAVGSAHAERKAYHVTGEWDVDVFFPYASNQFDIVFVYENELDYPALVDENDVPPPTAHAVDATDFLGSQFGDDQSRYLFKSYPVPDVHVPDLTGDPDPAGYSGVSFLRWYAVGEELDEQLEMVYTRSRKTSQASGERPITPLEIKAVNDHELDFMGTPLTADSVSIVDSMRISPLLDTLRLPAGVNAIEASRLEITFIDVFGTTINDKSLPASFDMSDINPQNGSFWSYLQPQLGPDVVAGSMEIHEILFGDANLDGVVDAADEAIFMANLDNNRDGLADVGGEFVYEIGQIVDDPNTPETEPSQPIGYATWLLGDFNLDGFVTDADAVYFNVALPGDGNGDGWVDGLDYLIWASNFGTNPGVGTGPGNGDYNDDGAVDGLDYLSWAANFGSHSSSGTTVPEPVGFGPLGLAVLSWVIARRSRRRQPT